MRNSQVWANGSCRTRSNGYANGGSVISHYHPTSNGNGNNNRHDTPQVTGRLAISMIAFINY